jgi:hypothetical protein
MNVAPTSGQVLSPILDSKRPSILIKTGPQEFDTQQSQVAKGKSVKFEKPNDKQHMTSKEFLL